MLRWRSRPSSVEGARSSRRKCCLQALSGALDVEVRSSACADIYQIPALSGISGGIRRQIYWLEKSRDWCVQFFRSSDCDARLLTKTFSESELNKFRAMAAAYNLMPWDCADGEFRRPQGRPLKRRVFSARDFEEGTAWYHYPPSLLLHPPPANGTSSARSRRKPETSLVQASDTRGGTSSPDGLLSAPSAGPASSDALSCSNGTPVAFENSVTRRGSRQSCCVTKVRSDSLVSSPGSKEAATCVGTEECRTLPRHLARGDSPSVIKRRAAHSRQSSSATLALPPGLLDSAATVAAAAFHAERTGQDGWTCWSSEKGGENSGVGGDRGGEKRSPEVPWHERTAAGVAADPRRPWARKEEGQSRFPAWLTGQAAAGERGAASLLRQLIRDQVEDDPAECFVSWSQTVSAQGRLCAVSKLTDSSSTLDFSGSSAPHPAVARLGPGRFTSSS